MGFQLGGAIDQLIELGLVRAEANRTLWLHRLVVAFTREAHGRAAGAGAGRGGARALRRGGAHERPARPGAAAWLAGPLRFIADAALPRGDASAADLCHALAEHLYQTGDYQGAIAYHDRALSIRQTVLGADHPATARSLTQIGKALLFYGDKAHARPYFDQALAIQQAKLGDHSDTATTLNHLAFCSKRRAR